jgi:alcohol dehydrogenase class IV
MQFEFATASRIVFGAGTLEKSTDAISGLGRHALVVTGRNTKRAERLIDLLEDAGVQASSFAVPGEPLIDTVREAVGIVRGSEHDLVIGIGGGSALDTAKAVAALAPNPGEILEYVEVIGAGKALRQPALPCVAIPTTAGTGAEVTRNAVLGSLQHRVKVSLRSPFLLPRLAVVDPELTYDMPPEVTARTGMDALTQLVEPFVSCRANPLTDALCLEGLQRVARSLRRAFDDGQDRAGREDMALASLFGGLALANAGLGAVHGFAGPIGGMYSAPHGGICAALLPGVMEVNVRALEQRKESTERFRIVATVLTGSSDAKVNDGIRWVSELCAALLVPSLARYGVSEDAFPVIVEKAEGASSTKANPVSLDRHELTRCLALAL